MLMNIWKREMMERIDKLAAGELTELRAVYSALAADEAELIRRGGEAVRAALAGMQRPQLLRLCERFREYTSLEWTIDWAEVPLDRIRDELPEEAYRYVLILGSFHPNGYFRERCLEEMAGYDGMLFWMLFRVNDWVWQIRDRAYEGVAAYLEGVDARELFEALPALERLQGCHRRTPQQMSRLWEQMEKRMLSALQETELCELMDMEPAARRSLYRVMIQAGAVTMEDMDTLLEGEKIPYLKGLLLRGILAQPGCTPAWAAKYLTDSSAPIRRMAVEYQYGQLKTCWHGLEELLLDSSRGVRENAAYILKRHSSLDIRGYYLGHLGDEKPEYAIMGLAEYCRRGNVAELMRCLDRPERKVLKYTLLALGYQEDFSDEELLWRYLLDGRNDISKAAYVSICKRDFHFGAQRCYEAYLKAEQEYHKRYLLRLLLREGSWKRLPCLIRLYGEELSADTAYRVLSGLRSRFMYEKITQALYEDILQALEENGEALPEGMKKAIAVDLKYVAPAL